MAEANKKGSSRWTSLFHFEGGVAMLRHSTHALEETPYSGIAALVPSEMAPSPR